MISTDLKFALVPYTRGVGVELSEGQRVPLFDHWISTSLTQGLKSLDLFEDRSLDFICGIDAVLSYPRKSLPKAVRQWWKKIKMGGSLVWIGDVQQVTREEILDCMKQCGSWDLAVNELHADEEDSLYSMVFVKTEAAGQTYSHLDPVPEKTVCIVRYGAIGDCIIASSILPGLKEQGWHVVFNTQATGYEILRGNPNIDEFLLQDKEQLPNEELPEYWSFLKRKYGRLINLSETMEGAICSVRWRPDFTWPDEVRRKFRAANYYEFAHTMADVPLPPQPSFHPTKKEMKWARKKRAEIGDDKFVVLWVISGSSVHKRIPQTDYVLGFPGNPGLFQQLENLHVVFVGDEMCKILTKPWEGHPGVTDAVADWSLRQTLAFINEADCVVGPETGMVNASGMMSVPTVLFLSHTSEDTVCRYWDDYIALEPDDSCECFPCYKLHHTNDACNLIETELYGELAACTASIGIDAVQNAITYYYNKHKAENAA